MSPPDDPRITDIETVTLSRKARSVVPRVRERALESLRNRSEDAQAAGDTATAEAYLAALRGVEHVGNPVGDDGKCICKVCFRLFRPPKKLAPNDDPDFCSPKCSYVRAQSTMHLKSSYKAR